MSRNTIKAPRGVLELRFYTRHMYFRRMHENAVTLRRLGNMVRGEFKCIEIPDR